LARLDCGSQQRSSHHPEIRQREKVSRTISVGQFRRHVERLKLMQRDGYSEHAFDDHVLAE